LARSILAGLAVVRGNHDFEDRPLPAVAGNVFSV